MTLIFIAWYALGWVGVGLYCKYYPYHDGKLTLCGLLGLIIGGLVSAMIFSEYAIKSINLCKIVWRERHEN